MSSGRDDKLTAFSAKLFPYRYAQRNEEESKLQPAVNEFVGLLKDLPFEPYGSAVEILSKGNNREIQSIYAALKKLSKKSDNAQKWLEFYKYRAIELDKKFDDKEKCAAKREYLDNLLESAEKPDAASYSLLLGCIYSETVEYKPTSSSRSINPSFLDTPDHIVNLFSRVLTLAFKQQLSSSSEPVFRMFTFDNLLAFLLRQIHKFANDESKDQKQSSDIETRIRTEIFNNICADWAKLEESNFFVSRASDLAVFGFEEFSRISYNIDVYLNLLRKMITQGVTTNNIGVGVGALTTHPEMFLSLFNQFTNKSNQNYFLSLLQYLRREDREPVISALINDAFNQIAVTEEKKEQVTQESATLLLQRLKAIYEPFHEDTTAILRNLLTNSNTRDVLMRNILALMSGITGSQLDVQWRTFIEQIKFLPLDYEFVIKLSENIAKEKYSVTSGSEDMHIRMQFLLRTYGNELGSFSFLERYEKEKKAKEEQQEKEKKAKEEQQKKLLDEDVAAVRKYLESGLARLLKSTTVTPEQVQVVARALLPRLTPNDVESNFVLPLLNSDSRRKAIAHKDSQEMRLVLAEYAAAVMLSKMDEIRAEYLKDLELRKTKVPNEYYSSAKRFATENMAPAVLAQFIASAEFDFSRVESVRGVAEQFCSVSDLDSVIQSRFENLTEQYMGRREALLNLLPDNDAFVQAHVAAESKAKSEVKDQPAREEKKKTREEEEKEKKRIDEEKKKTRENLFASFRDAITGLDENLFTVYLRAVLPNVTLVNKSTISLLAIDLLSRVYNLFTTSIQEFAKTIPKNQLDAALTGYFTNNFALALARNFTAASQDANSVDVFLKSIREDFEQPFAKILQEIKKAEDEKRAKELAIAEAKAKEDERVRLQAQERAKKEKDEKSLAYAKWLYTQNGDDKKTEEFKKSEFAGSQSYTSTDFASGLKLYGKLNRLLELERGSAKRAKQALVQDAQTNPNRGIQLLELVNFVIAEQAKKKNAKTEAPKEAPREAPKEEEKKVVTTQVEQHPPTVAISIRVLSPKALFEQKFNTAMQSIAAEIKLEHVSSVDAFRQFLTTKNLMISEGQPIAGFYRTEYAAQMQYGVIETFRTAKVEALSKTAVVTPTPTPPPSPMSSSSSVLRSLLADTPQPQHLATSRSVSQLSTEHKLRTSASSASFLTAPSSISVSPLSSTQKKDEDYSKDVLNFLLTYKRKMTSFQQENKADSREKCVKQFAELLVLYRPNVANKIAGSDSNKLEKCIKFIDDLLDTTESSIKWKKPRAPQSSPHVLS